MNMPSDNPNPYAMQPRGAVPTPVVVTAIVPARNEEAVIAASIETLSRQPEIAQILVVNDQSSDATAEVVRNLVKEIPDLRLLETGGLPDGWVGKNYALWVGVQQATSPWLLFTDADALHAPNSVARGLQIARERQAASANVVAMPVRRPPPRWPWAAAAALAASLACGIYLGSLDSANALFDSSPAVSDDPVDLAGLGDISDYLEDQS